MLTTTADSNSDNEQYERFERALPEAFAAATADGGPLFTTDASDLFEVFLGALPAERRQHYTCHACRRFLNRFGSVVRIEADGRKRSPLHRRKRHDELDVICGAHHIDAMVEVIALDEFSDWYGSLSDDDADAVSRSVDVLEILGVALGYPQSSAVKSASFGLRELRIQSGGKPLRVFYAFDPARQAVLILGGDKTGDKRFYETTIDKCETTWREYLKSI